MNIPWFAIAVILAIFIVLQELTIFRQRSKIKTLEHYIDMYKNKLEAEVLDGKSSKK